MIQLNEKSKNRIQIIRAIAIISVLVIHTAGQSPYELYIRPLVNFGVGVFLFLSGFLTPRIEDVIDTSIVIPTSLLTYEEQDALEVERAIFNQAVADRADEE